ncbi:MAG: hypothetical protein U0X20_16405 [Caldilineaceae bacterium]
MATSKRLWKPVRDQAADSFWMLLITALSITVMVTRVYLELTGYPQVGDSTYHVAHVLWGGLLLFIAVALPLSIVNRYALWTSAILGGIGAGLFIDEVGKFITQSNDYFFPLAFPIIYGFILVCVWLYWRIRRHQPRDTRTLLYHALEDLKQVLDNDLDPFEHRELLTELKLVTEQATDPSELRLAKELLDFVQSRELRLAMQPNFAERLIEDLRRVFANRPAKWVLKTILVFGWGLMSINALIQLTALFALASEQGLMHKTLSEFVVVSGKSKYVVNNVQLLLLTQLLVIAVGLMALAAVVLLLIRRDERGVRIGTVALIFSLCVVNFLAFYFAQIYALLQAAGQVFLLVVAGLYRWRFLDVATRTVGKAKEEAAVGD